MLSIDWLILSLTMGLHYKAGSSQVKSAFIVSFFICTGHTRKMKLRFSLYTMKDITFTGLTFTFTTDIQVQDRTINNSNI